MEINNLNNKNLEKINSASIYLICSQPEPWQFSRCLQIGP